VSRTLRVRTYLAPSLRPLYERVSEELSHALGLSATLRDGRDPRELARDDVDVAFVCGLPYVELSDHLELLGAPVLAGERYGGRPVYFSDVIVRREDPARSFADLRRRSWAYNEPRSHSGYNVTRAHLVALGETRGFFSGVQAAGSHAESIKRVEAGEVDAAAIDSQVLAVELRERPELGKRLRVIDALGPSAIQPVVASKRVDPGLRRALREALIALDAHPAMAHALVERFERVDDSHYDGIRASLAACREAGFLEIR
jgi:ABC-type phosphate/phosphonate transport system substrate-binding protein